jgi:hypothetical protein
MFDTGRMAVGTPVLQQRKNRVHMLNHCIGLPELEGL